MIFIPFKLVQVEFGMLISVILLPEKSQKESSLSLKEKYSGTHHRNGIAYLKSVPY